MNAEAQYLDLYATLDRRSRPEEVAAMILGLYPANSLITRERNVLGVAAKGAHSWSSMSNDFARVVPMTKQLSVAGALLNREPPDGLDLPAIHTFVDGADAYIHKTRGKSDFKSDRLNRESRRNHNLGEMSRRRYNKLFRVICRLEDKERKVAYELEKRGLIQVSKARLASQISLYEFAKDMDSAAFIAYYAARCNLRSEFTIGGQTKPYDDIADMLYKRCVHSPSANWLAIAHVYPISEVVARLTHVQQSQMLNKWFDILTRTAKMLKGVWDGSDINRKTMTVARGNDSTTWNVLAGAWNKARDGWISLIYAMGADGIVEKFCPGKCMRLIAADVVAWHRSAGQGCDPNQLIWNEIPLPWEVMEGTVHCDREMIVRVCKKHSVDPEKTGWVAPRPASEPRPFTPTPELVHGVTVSNPLLAAAFRKLGWFSGKAKLVHS